MRYSDNYELNLVEGSDIVNPLVQDVPNYETIDDAMFENKKHSVGVATELKTGTVHALTRQNKDAAVFRFTATSDFTAGDTFEVDGVQVSALLVDGTALPNRCYIIGSEVLASLKGTLLTVYANRTTASDSDKLGGQLPAYYATDADLDSLEGVVEAHTNQIGQLNLDLSDISEDIKLLATLDGATATNTWINVNIADSARIDSFRSFIVSLVKSDGTVMRNEFIPYAQMSIARFNTNTITCSMGAVTGLTTGTLYGMCGLYSQTAFSLWISHANYSLKVYGCK